MDDTTGDKEVIYENTYITSPEGYGKVSRKKRLEGKGDKCLQCGPSSSAAVWQDTKFSAKKVKEILVEILNSKFEGMAYDQSQVSLLTKELSETIREKVKELKYTRYKTVVEVTIGQKVGQAIRQVSESEEERRGGKMSQFMVAVQIQSQLQSVHGFLVT